ncbi:hypothetical protein RND81_02G026600 [Saponaria officinalis]|uniref:non-reducing end alpha-L-arabinofuranosidase n=1 Tax=Saponaria officinalis TaxID=3572 RepID=A0AAW1MQB1_SAPOF
MATSNHIISFWFLLLGVLFISQTCFANDHHRSASLSIDMSSGRTMPNNFFGIFFEEINHAGAGGLWAELVSNRGFEAGGRHVPSMISPWGMIGDEKTISIITEMSSKFETNPMALRMDVHCNSTTCPPGGVGIYNPGYWGMNIEEGKTYKVVFYVKSSGDLKAILSLVSDDGTEVLAFKHLVADAEKMKKWTKIETTLTATGSDPKARLQLTTTQNGTIWLDQVSAMPTDTYKGHGFRKDLMKMLLNLKPRFLRFPGGCYVEGTTLANAFRWKETVGPWEERPGHLGDVWNYWSDDGLGYLEYLQLAEDLGAEPVWVINNGFSHTDSVDPSLIQPFVQEMLDSIEFARGNAKTSKWGSLRAKLGHPAPFSLKYIAIGNEDCWMPNYRENYVKFYKAVKKAYPDIKTISNCDASSKDLDHPADLYDYHNYTTAEGMLQNTRLFEKMSRNKLHAPKAFVSEYAVTEPKADVINGTFKGALAEAAFLLSLEKNSDVVEMVSYAPLFVNQNDKRWNPDAISFNSNKAFGISSYWVQTFFKESSGAVLLDSHLHIHAKDVNIYATAIKWTDKTEKKIYMTVKVVNFNHASAKLDISLEGFDRKLMKLVRQTVLSSDDLEGDNSFDNPTKVVPETSTFKANDMKAVHDLVVEPYSFTAFDFML